MTAERRRSTLSRYPGVGSALRGRRPSAAWAARTAGGRRSLLGGGLVLGGGAAAAIGLEPGHGCRSRNVSRAIRDRRRAGLATLAAGDGHDAAVAHAKCPSRQ